MNAIPMKNYQTSLSDSYEFENRTSILIVIKYMYPFKHCCIGKKTAVGTRIWANTPLSSKWNRDILLRDMKLEICFHRIRQGRRNGTGVERRTANP